ncbi:Lrp/AsnC family transcriptional regulator [Pseudahrensia aquimaris]|uniref:Lrp/AsnC family transcriptional regulator n=1 Tax=Pseudahrensia aquimaris TaxID=744461 RepID=A0ABW3FFS6_9HYPH
MFDLTPTDRKLLAALKSNARASITTLAQQIGVSRATVQSSMERLVNSNTIQRFTIDIDSSAGGELVRAVMTIEVQGNLTSTIIKSLRQMPEIVSLHSTNGAWDLVAYIETSSLPEFDGLLRRTREIAGILNSETSILLNTAK